MSETLSIQHLFPSSVKSYCSRVKDYTEELHPEEVKLVSKAIDKRRYEFSTGRFCARKALQQLGIDNCVLKQGKNGEPLWPDQTTGSISHSSKWAAACVSTTKDIMAVGFDIETINRISSGILKRIITEKEKELQDKKDEQDAQIYAALIFSTKEAIYKALSKLYSKTLRFKDVSIIPNVDKSEFKIELNDKELNSFLKNVLPFCRYFIHENDIFTAITFLRV